MKRAIIIASLLAVAAMGTRVAVGPAFSEPASHTLTFVSHNLVSQQTPPNHLLQASTNQVSGAGRVLRSGMNRQPSGWPHAASSFLLADVLDPGIMPW